MRPFLGSILLLTVLATACNKTNNSPGLVGVWKMVDYSQGPSNPAVAPPADSAVVMYLWSNNHYLERSAGAIVDSGVYVYDNNSPVLTLNSRKWLESSPPFLVNLHQDTLSLFVNASEAPAFRYVRISLFWSTPPYPQFEFCKQWFEPCNAMGTIFSSFVSSIYNIANMAKNNKIALVTGGSRGLGKEMALRLAEKGIDVILTFNSKEAEANDVVASIEKTGQKAAALQFDAGNIAGFDGFVTRLIQTLKEHFNTDHFDCLINNAGVGVHAAFAETTEAEFDSLMNIHLKGPFFLTQKLLPHLNDGGRIINLSSGLARFSTPGYAAYAAMKGAMETLTKYQAKELGSRGITVNIVAPGAIATDFGGGMVRDNAQVNQFIAGVTALGRVGLPEDIGGVVAFLCTDDARWITAQRIEISGGQSL
jgi:NAD(P)-dependent dehydrogenase (short-subunit alcohol dehydrogenase family)